MWWLQNTRDACPRWFRCVDLFLISSYLRAAVVQNHLRKGIAWGVCARGWGCRVRGIWRVPTWL